MLRARGRRCCSLSGGDLVIAGGTSWNEDVKLWLKDVQIYHPATDRWREGPSLPVALAYGPFVNSNDGLEILGGIDGQTAHRTSWKFEFFENPMGKDWYRRQPTPCLAAAARIC